MKLDGRVYWQSIDHQLCFPDRLFTLFSYSCIICVCTFLHNVTNIVNIFKGHVTLRSFSKTIYPTGTFCIFMLCFSYSQKSNLGVKKRHKKTFCKLVVDLLSLIFYIFHIYIYIFFINVSPVAASPFNTCTELQSVTAAAGPGGKPKCTCYNGRSRVKTLCYWLSKNGKPLTEIVFS